MENLQIASTLEEVADLLEIQEGNPFRVRAYRTAARTVESLGEPVAALVRRGGVGALEGLPGIGKDLAHKIATLAESGELPLLRELADKTPPTLVQMMRLAGVGPKRAKLFYSSLGIATVAALGEAARSGRLLGVRGIGEKLASQIGKECERALSSGRRFATADAEVSARRLVRHLAADPGALEIEVAGSFRRRKDTIGDLDVLVASETPASVAQRFLSYPEVVTVLARGETKCSVVLRSGLQVDLRIVPPGAFGAALHYFTGSKAHNIAVRTLGLKKGLKINEYGVFRDDERIGGRTELEVFAAVGLPRIPPELREASGEIEAALEGRLPELVEIGDLRADLHLHTTYTDGAASLEEMVRACQERGYEYLAITDHTRALAMVGGLDGAGFREQGRAIAKLAPSFPDITILHGAEVDILEDGSLDLDDETLATLDVVLVALHSSLRMDEKAMTERVLRALENPFVSILSHPTARRIGRREPVALDLERVIRAAAESGVMLEIDAQPERLDLRDVHVRMAVEAGAKLVISTDAHRLGELDFMRFGVDQARRGWCTKRDIANTSSLDDFLALVGRRRAHLRASPRSRAAGRFEPAAGGYAASRRR